MSICSTPTTKRAASLPSRMRVNPPGATSRRASVPQSRSSCMLIEVPNTTASSTNMRAKPGTRCSKTVTESRLPVRFCSLRVILSSAKGSASAAASLSISSSSTFTAPRSLPAAGSVRSWISLERPCRYCLLSCGGNTIAAAASCLSLTSRSASARLTSRTSACSARSFWKVPATGPPSWFTIGTRSFGPSSPWNNPSAMTVITKIGIRIENNSAERSRRKRRRSLRKTASMGLQGVSLPRSGHLGAQAVEQALERVLRHRGVELGAEVLRQAHALDHDVGHAPALGVAVQRIVDREPVARGDHVGPHLRLVAVHLLLAVGEIGSVEEEQPLYVGAHEELVEEREELLGLLRAPPVQVLSGGEASERVRVEEPSQEVAQLSELLLAIALPFHDRVAPREDVACERHRALGLGCGRVAGSDDGQGRCRENRAGPTSHQSRSAFPVSSKKTSSSVTGVTRVRTTPCPMADSAR